MIADYNEKIRCRVSNTDLMMILMNELWSTSKSCAEIPKVFRWDAHNETLA